MNRNTLRVWASSKDAQVTDPDLDVNHPGGEGGREKYERGWVVEKEPHQWANFIYNNVDASLEEALENGTLYWEAVVTYKENSVVVYNGVMYRATTSNKGQAPNLLVGWEIIPYQTAGSLEAFLNTYQQILTSHKGETGAMNPHHDDAGKANTYTKAESDAKVKAVRDELNGHKAQANPHNLNAADVGCLDARQGGHFTGVVIYGAGVRFGTQEYGIDNDGLFSPKDSFSIVNNIPYQKTSKQEIVTDKSYNKINMKNNSKFALPEVDVLIALTGSLSSLSEGNYTLSYGRSSVLVYVDRSGKSTTASADEPAFGELGMYLTTDTVFLFSGLMSGTAATMCYELDNVTIVKTVDVSSDNLIDYIGTSGQVRNIQIWFTPLSAKQESMLGG